MKNPERVSGHDLLKELGRKLGSLGQPADPDFWRLDDQMQADIDDEKFSKVAAIIVSIEAACEEAFERGDNDDIADEFDADGKGDLTQEEMDKLNSLRAGVQWLPEEERPERLMEDVIGEGLLGAVHRPPLSEPLKPDVVAEILQRIQSLTKDNCDKAE